MAFRFFQRVYADYHLLFFEYIASVVSLGLLYYDFILKLQVGLRFKV